VDIGPYRTTAKTALTPDEPFALDGGGVVPDLQLPEVTWLRLRTSDDPADDVRVYVEDGQVHVVGQYATVHAERVAPNHVALNTVRPPRRDPV